MAWKEAHVMDGRMKFIGEWLTGEFTMAELCRRFEVSRKTGYKYIARYQLEGPAGLEDRSCAPRHHPNAVDDQCKDMILAAKKDHPSWGAKKLKKALEEDFADRDWPARSTITEILDRHGLVRRRKLRRRGASQLSPLTAVECANQVWGADFKGWWLTKDGWRCLPFTLSDLKSRYLLRVQAVDKPDGRHIWPILEATFYEVGLPEVIRFDNGPPFATVGAGGLSWLAVQLVKAGVRPERIKPGKPQQNGRHERMHRTLKEDTTRPTAANRREQQRRFDKFRRIFNEERPHEALGLDTPAKHYQPSPRIYSGRLREPEYPDDHQVRRVRSNGEIKWLGEKVFLSAALIGEPVGIQETDDGLHTVHFGPVFLGYLNRDGSFSQRSEMPKKQQSQGQKV
jgi:transposase InsO family protein